MPRVKHPCEHHDAARIFGATNQVDRPKYSTTAPTLKCVNPTSWGAPLPPGQLRRRIEVLSCLVNRAVTWQ